MDFAQLPEDLFTKAVEDAERLEYTEFTSKFELNHVSHTHTWPNQNKINSIQSFKLDSLKKKDSNRSPYNEDNSPRQADLLSSKQKNFNLDKQKETSPKLEYKDFKSRFYKIELAGFKGENRTIQLQERSTNLIYQLIEKNIPITSFDTEIKRYERLAKLKHQNILQLCYYTFQFMEENHGEPYCQISLLFENTENDLEKLCASYKKNKTNISDKNLLSIIRQCISGMAYLQSEGISHGNLTLKNFFVHKDNVIKILPNYFEKAKAPNASFLYKNGIPENIYYFSPEVYRQKNWRVPYEKHVINPFKADVFTLGMNLLELALLRKGSKCYHLYELADTSLLEMINNVKSLYSDVTSALFSQMLTYDEQLRPDFIELHNNIENMGLPNTPLSLITRLEESTSLQKINNPDYLPQDFVNEIEGKIQQYQKKHASKIVEVVYPNGNKYVGELNNQKEPHGVGSLWWADGDRYEGFWKNGLYEGEGMYYFGNGMKHYGFFKDGEVNGLGVRYYSEKGLYFGDWKNGKNDGKGIYIWPNGEKFIGNFKDDDIHGPGMLTWLTGRKIEGIWSDKGEGIGLAQKPKFDDDVPTLQTIRTQRSSLRVQNL